MDLKHPPWSEHVHEPPKDSGSWLKEKNKISVGKQIEISKVSKREPEIRKTEQHLASMTSSNLL